MSTQQSFDYWDYFIAEAERANAPLYTQMPSGLSVLYFRLRCENPSGKGALLRIVSYGDAAKRDSRTLQEGAPAAPFPSQP